MDCGLFEFSCHYDSIMLGLLSAFAAIPVPDFLSDGITIPDTIAWIAGVVELQIGLTIWVSALTARFILRRIPGIG